MRLSPPQLSVMRVWLSLLLLVVGAHASTVASDEVGAGLGPRACTVASPVKRLALHHIRKTGGSTLTTVLNTFGQEHDVLIGATHHVTPKHLATTFSQAFRVAIFREPVSRVVSHYYQVRPTATLPGSSHLPCRRAAAAGFEDYLEKCYFARNHQFAQLVELFPGAVPPLEKTLAQYNLVMLTDHFHEALVLLHFRIGIPVRTLLYWRMKDHSTRLPDEDLVLTPELRARILAANQRDVAVWEAAQHVYNATLTKMNCDFHGAVQRYESLLNRWLEQCGDNTYQGEDNRCTVNPTRDCDAYVRITTLNTCRQQFCQENAACRENRLYAEDIP